MILIYMVKVIGVEFIQKNIAELNLQIKLSEEDITNAKQCVNTLRRALVAVGRATNFKSVA